MVRGWRELRGEIIRRMVVSDTVPSPARVRRLSVRCVYLCLCVCSVCLCMSVLKLICCSDAMYKQLLQLLFHRSVRVRSTGSTTRAAAPLHVNLELVTTVYHHRCMSAVPRFRSGPSSSRMRCMITMTLLGNVSGVFKVSQHVQ